jgi:hypothetical protein
MSANTPEPKASATTSASESLAPIHAAGARPKHVVTFALAAGMLATVLSGAVGEKTFGWFIPKRAANAVNPMEVQFEPAELNRVDVQNATLAYALQGAVLGLMLGVAGAAARRSGFAAAKAGLLGLVLGAGLGAAATYSAFTAYFRLSDMDRREMLPSLLAHAAAWGAIGAAAGLAFGVGLSGARIVRALQGGIAGAVLGALVYEVAGSIAFPLGQTAEPLAESVPARLFAHATINLLAALGAAFFAETAETAKPRTTPRRS